MQKINKKRNIFGYIREQILEDNNLVHIELRFQNLVMQYFYKR